MLAPPDEQSMNGMLHVGAAPGCNIRRTIVPVRILLVEDEPAAARMLAKGLREQAYAVDVSGDGNDAAFRMATTDYDAVLLDVTLPGKTGLELAREWRAAGAAVPILMLT